MRKMSQEPLLNEYIFNICAFNTTFIGDVQYFFLKKRLNVGKQTIGRHE